MWCIHNGKSCVMVWHIKNCKWVYIPFKKWLSMPDHKRAAYIID